MNHSSHLHKDLLQSMLKEKEGRNILVKGNPERQLYENFPKWLKQKGAQFSKIEIRYYAPSYRGVHAIKTIMKGETFLFVPHEYMITLSKAKESPIGKKINDAKLRLIYPNNSNLSHFVLEEMSNPNSKWNMYFKMLPNDLSSFPIFYTHNERQLLKNTVFDEDIDELISDMRKDYDNICKVASEFKKHKFDDFMRTRALVNSRIFGVKINNVQDDSIVPLADMFNYSHSINHSQW